MDKLFHPTPHWVCDYLSMLELKLIHVSKKVIGDYGIKRYNRHHSATVVYNLKGTKYQI